MQRLIQWDTLSVNLPDITLQLSGRTSFWRQMWLIHNLYSFHHNFVSYFTCVYMCVYAHTHTNTNFSESIVANTISYSSSLPGILLFYSFKSTFFTSRLIVSDTYSGLHKSFHILKVLIEWLYIFHSSWNIRAGRDTEESSFFNFLKNNK